MKNKNCFRYLRDLKHLMPIYGKKQRKYLYTLKQINRNYYLQIILRILFISAFVCCILYGINCYRAYLHCIQSELVYMYEEISTDNVNK